MVVLVDAAGEHLDESVNVDFPDAEHLVFEVEEDRGAFVLVLKDILEGLLEVRLLRMLFLLGGSAAAVIHLNDGILLPGLLGTPGL